MMSMMDMMAMMPMHHHHAYDPYGGHHPVQNVNKMTFPPMVDFQALANSFLSNFSVCCMPMGCLRPSELIADGNPADAVRMMCSNSHCTHTRWMHRRCYEIWEDKVTQVNSNPSRGKFPPSFNQWTDCKCGSGYIHRDISFRSPRARRPSTDSSTGSGCGGSRPTSAFVPQSGMGQPVRGLPITRAHFRPRTPSLTSTGSSPPSGSSDRMASPDAAAAAAAGGGGASPPLPTLPTLTPEQAIAGNIFHRRRELSAFAQLPASKQNPYHIKTEDEGLHGNDDIRQFLLTNLSRLQATSSCCLLCASDMIIYDRFPIVDGTFFLSPVNYGTGFQVQWQSRTQYLHSVCVTCLEGVASRALCSHCGAQWDGSSLILGTMYTYDVFAARPCCGHRLTCKSCNYQIVKGDALLPFFSDYSRATVCSRCGFSTHHFCKPVSDTFVVRSHECPSPPGFGLPAVGIGAR